MGLGHWSVPGGASKPRGVATDLQLQCLRIPPIGPVPPKGTGSTGGGLRIITPTQPTAPPVNGSDTPPTGYYQDTRSGTDPARGGKAQ